MGVDMANKIYAIDLFCGAGGLTYGLRQAGINVVAGIDIDPDTEHAYSINNKPSRYILKDIADVTPEELDALYPKDGIKLLAGCAPCQPFSKLTNGTDGHKSFNMLDYFGRLITSIKPDLVMMENVPELTFRGKDVFARFLKTLQDNSYEYDCKVLSCFEYGVPQSRKRLVLLASKIGKIGIPAGTYSIDSIEVTVKHAISSLPPIEAGEICNADFLHAAAKCSNLNMKRLRATKPDGGSRDSWPDELILDCHKKESGKSYKAIYGRMWWDRPAPTITTLCLGIGNGRFGHPEQNRAMSMREAALLQSFPVGYEFWPADKKVSRKAISRMIGNAVPPMLAKALGNALISSTTN